MYLPRVNRAQIGRLKCRQSVNLDRLPLWIGWLRDLQIAQFILFNENT